MKALIRNVGVITITTMFITLLFITFLLSSNTALTFAVKIFMPILFFVLNLILLKTTGKSSHKKCRIFSIIIGNVSLGAAFTFLLNNPS